MRRKSLKTLSLTLAAVMVVSSFNPVAVAFAAPVEDVAVEQQVETEEVTTEQASEEVAEEVVTEATTAESTSEEATTEVATEATTEVATTEEVTTEEATTEVVKEAEEISIQTDKIEESEKRTASSSAYLSTIMKDTTLLGLVVEAYNSKYGTSLTNATIKVSHLQAYNGALTFSAANTNVKSIDGLGLAQNATSIDITGFTKVTSIADAEFQGCAFTTFKMPTSITSIGDKAFYECTKMTAIYTGSTANTLPSNLTSLGQQAFYSCTGLTQITIPKLSDEGAVGAFQSCSNLTKVTFGNNVTVIPVTAFHSAGRGSTGMAVTFGTGLDKVLGNAFFNAKFASGATLDFSGCTKMTGIDAAAFRASTNLTNVILPKTLVSGNTLEIGAYAFAETSLKKLYPSGTSHAGIYLPNYTAPTLGQGAFYGNTVVTAVSLAPSLTAIQDYTFDGCTSLATVTQRDGSNVTWIGDCAFRYTAISNTDFMLKMTKLTQIGRQLHDTIDNGDSTLDIESIPLGGINTTKYEFDISNISKKKFDKKPVGSEVFTDCPNLTSIKIPSSVKIIGQRAFYFNEDDELSKVESFTWSNGTAVAGTQRKIWAEAFVGNYLLEKVVLPENKGESLVIGPSAFRYNFALESVGSASSSNNTLPSTMSELGSNAFNGCIALPQVHIQKYNGATPKLGVQAFEMCYSLTKATLPATTVEIPYNFYAGCPLDSFNFKDMTNLEEINQLVFMGNQFTSVDLSACTKLKELGAGSFAYEDAVKKDYMGVKDYFISPAPETSPKLTKMILPKTVEKKMSFETALFYAQENFTTLYKNGSTVSGKVVIPSYVAPDDGTAEGIFAYSGVSNVVWEADTNSAASANRWKKVGPFMYEGCTRITDVKNVLPVYVEDIYAAAFAYSEVPTADFTSFKNLSKVSTGSVDGDAKGVFHGCEYLTKVTFPSTTTASKGIIVGTETFKQASALTTVDFGAVSEISSKAFEECTGLTKIALKNVKIVGSNAFLNCTNLKTVDFGKVEEIDTQAFYKCSSLVLTGTVFPDTLKVIGSNAFNGLPNLGVVTFGAGLEEIKGAAFKGSGTTKADFSRAVALTEMGTSTFEGTKITNFNISGTQLAEVPQKMLYKCEKLTSVSFGEEIGYISKNALAGCPLLKTFNFYTTTTVDQEVFYEPGNDGALTGQDNGSSTDTNISITFTANTPKETVIPLDREMNFPYYVNTENTSDIDYISIVDKNAPTDLTVEEHLYVSAETNNGYYKVKNSNDENGKYRVTDEEYFKGVTVASTATMNGEKVDVIRVKGLKPSGSRNLEFNIYAGLTFKCKTEGVSIAAPSFEAKYKVKVMDVNTYGVLYSDSKLTKAIASKDKAQATKANVGIPCYYDLEDEVANDAPQNNYNLIVKTSNADILAVNDVSNYKTASNTCTVEATDENGKTSNSKKVFYIYPKKRGTATITVYPALYDAADREKHKKTYTFTVNSNIKSLTLAIPTEYKKKLNPGASFCVFKEYTNFFGETCTVDKMTNYNKYTDTTITYSSSDPDYVSVDQKGNVKILKADPTAKTVKIMATYPGATKDVTKTLSFKISYPEVKKNAEITDKLTGSEVKVTKVSTKDLEGEVQYQAPTNKKLSSISIPDTISINGLKYKVTSISPKAFKGNKKIKTIKIGKYVKTIGAEAFSGCTKLTKVTIGNGVETIDKKAFYKCTRLKTVSISASKSKLKTIGNSAFYNCKKIKKINLPKKFKKLDSKSFYNCKSLKTITVKSTALKTVGKDALKGIHKKAVIKVPKKKLKAYKKLFKGKGQKSSVKIKKG